jgi:hypothetical protein
MKKLGIKMVGIFYIAMEFPMVNLDAGDRVLSHLGKLTLEGHTLLKN